MFTQQWLKSACLVAALVQPLWAAAATSSTAVQGTAQSAARSALPDQPLLTAQTHTGQAVSLEALRGQVVLIFVWSTDCPVCLSKMPELRANLVGWASQGFQIISINTDAHPDPLRIWEAARQATLPTAQHWPSVWAYAPGFATSLPVTGPLLSHSPTGPSAARPPATATRLPAIYVVDRQGKLRFHATGRVPAEVWDTVAELL